jgi:two-component system, NarL family, response regulator NreC
VRCGDPLPAESAGRAAVSKIRVLIADDHVLLRAGLALLINAQPDMEVAAEAGTVAEAVEKTAEYTPDVLLLDLTFPDGSGLKALEEIRRCSPAVRVLVLTVHDEPSYLMSALAAGATGYLVKSADPAELRAAIRAVSKGRSYIDVPMRGGGLEALLSQRSPAAPVEAGVPVRLSRRELQILRLLALGHTYREIASQLQVSERSVETYRARLAEKLGIRSRAGLVRHALMIGLLDEPNLP